MLNYDDLFTERSKNVKSSVIRDLLSLASRPGIISFGGGMPDPDLFPVKEFKECMDTALLERAAISLQYGETPGYYPLRESLVKLSEEDGINGVAVDNIIITTASQQAIDFISKIFIDKGDTVIVEAPTYLSAIQSFNAFLANFVSVPMDENGAIISVLESKLKELKAKGIKPKFFYTVPTFQNPAGVCMSLERRKELIQLAKEYNLLIIEDNPYGDLRYKGDPLPSLKSLDTDNNVVYLRTFSKILAPGIRLGWIVGPKEIISKINLLKQATDLCTPVITQVAVDEYLRKGYLRPHIEKIKASYSVKCKVMVDAIRKYFPEEVKINEPEGGMFLWASAPEKVDTVSIFNEAIAEGVAYIVGTAFFADGSGANTMRLNFTMVTPEKIEEGIKRLGNLLKKKLV
jgi:2-aminoadipate transaminase